jgi:hypothetical protein
LLCIESGVALAWTAGALKLKQSILRGFVSRLNGILASPP